MIRKARMEDLDRILEIFEIAKAFMRENGNHKQWEGDKPGRELIIQDISTSQGYCIEEAGNIVAYFMILEGIESTYNYIEGAWLNDERYVTIHRIAGDQSSRGMLGKCISYAESFGTDIRIDTHKDNIVMQNALKKFGFAYCGIIYLKNGDERLAYQRLANTFQGVNS